MDENKTVALMVLIVALFAFWLHVQGKLLPSLDVVFGASGNPLHIGAASPAPAVATASAPAPVGLIPTLTQAAITAIGAATGKAPALPAPSHKDGTTALPPLPGSTPLFY